MEKTISTDHIFMLRRVTMLVIVFVVVVSFTNSSITLANIGLTEMNDYSSGQLSGLLSTTVISCAAPVRIMPLGDSISVGLKSVNKNGYRKPLFLALTESGYWVDFVGGQTAGDSDFDRDHEGHSGFHAEDSTGIYRDIKKYVYQWLSKNPAEIILLHIGTNDISLGGQDANEVSRILDEIDRYDPGITVILAKIINRKIYNLATTQYNNDLEVMANQRIANGDKIVIVDTESALSYPGDLKDELHPNDQGYGKIAKVWESALEGILPSCSSSAKIITSPVVNGIVNHPYTYDVDASGVPVPSYTLLSSPDDMMIDTVSGIISWLPPSAGSFGVTVQASNELGSDVQTFSILVGEAPTPTPTSTNPPKICNVLIQEAEEGILSGGFTAGTDPAASGGAYVHVPDGFGDFPGAANNNNYARYCFLVNTPGNYRIAGWVYTTSLSSNSFHVQVDGSPVEGFYWEFSKSRSYILDYVNNFGVIDPVEVFLNPGDHIITIFLSEDGARLDKLELIYVPEPAATPSPSDDQ